MKGVGRKTRVSTTTRKRDKAVTAAVSADDDVPNSSSNFCQRSIEELPRYISMDILVRLSVNILLLCRCVCKTWRNLISDPEFAKMQFAKSQVYSLVRCLPSSTYISRTLYLVEPPNYYHFNFKPSEHGKLTPPPKLKLPLRNFDDQTLANLNAQLEVGSKRKRCMKLSANEHRLKIANSCRGFLCLCEPFHDNPVAVCNPITGEFLNLPALTPANESLGNPNDCALGFSPLTNEYKVIRLFGVNSNDTTRDPITQQETRIGNGRVAEIHTLGTNSWRKIGDAPFSIHKLRYPTYLNGAVHWLYSEEEKSDYIISFNFVDEQFKTILVPPRKPDMSYFRSASLGELRGCLYMCSIDKNAYLVLWVMKDYGVQGSWTMERRSSDSSTRQMWLGGSKEPLTILSDGGLLVFKYFRDTLFYIDSDGQCFKSFKLCGFKSKYEAITYTPSFISLKDVVAGKDVEVLNVSSRCAAFKFPGESKSLSLEESTFPLRRKYY